MKVAILNKSARPEVSANLTKFLPMAPMLGSFLKQPDTSVRIVKDSSEVGANDVAVLIEDDGRFVSVRTLFPIG